MSHIVYKVETEREEDGRWIAEIVDVPGVLAYGATENEAVASAQALALRILADRIETQKDPLIPSLSPLKRLEREPLAQHQGCTSFPGPPKNRLHG